MNYFGFVLKTATIDLYRNKGRTLLTSLGIMIGVMSVVLLIAFGLGLKLYIKQQFDSLGSNQLRILPGQVIRNGSFRASPGVSTTTFSERDVSDLKRIKELLYVVPVFTKSTTLNAGANTEFSDIYMTTQDVFDGLNLKAKYGSVFTKTQVDNRSKIIVIGPKIAEKLFDSAESAVGRNVKVDKQTFKVVGVLEAKGGGGFGGPDLDSFVYMPYKTGFIFNTDKSFAAMIIRAQPTASLTVAKARIVEVLSKHYKEDDFSVVEQTEILGAISQIFNILNSVLVAIAAISLVVGGIGIMNIMYVTVTERIKEIGIRRAIGARRNDILAQFVVQAVILSLFGGLLGLLFAYIITIAIQSFFPAYIDLNSVALALGVSTAIGVIFGVFPAKKASDLSPIESIRYE